MDLSGLSAITNTPKLETTKQRNQFFDNYSVLSIPDINIVDQVQLQNIQTFAPSHRQIGLDGLNKIKGITTGLTTQGVMVTPEDFKGIKIQNGKITVADMDSKSQGVKDIVGAANTVLQEVKSLNQKELNSLKLTISDMKNMQRIMPIIQQQFDTPIAKGGKVNGISVDVNAMNVEINNARQELNTLIPKLTFADFGHFMNASTSPNGKLMLPNYNKDTASDNLNRFIEISNQGSKYVDTRLLADTILIPFSLEDTITSATIEKAPTFLPPAEGGAFDYMPSTTFATFENVHPISAFIIKDPITIIPGKTNGFLNIAPDVRIVNISDLKLIVGPVPGPIIGPFPFPPKRIPFNETQTNLPESVTLR